MKYVFCALIILLVVFHQDYWQWGRSDLVFGFVPYPLAYHMAISMAASVVWIILVTFCWPSDELDESQDESFDAPSNTSEGGE